MRLLFMLSGSLNQFLKKCAEIFLLWNFFESNLNLGFKNKRSESSVFCFTSYLMVLPFIVTFFAHVERPLGYCI